jgi:transcriptional regulator with XRE-family HTH domain
MILRDYIFLGGLLRSYRLTAKDWRSAWAPPISGRRREESSRLCLAEIARRMPCDETVVQCWARGARPVKPEHLPRLAEVLGMTIDALLERRDPTHVPIGQLTRWHLHPEPDAAPITPPRVEKIQGYTVGGWQLARGRT